MYFAYALKPLFTEQSSYHYFSLKEEILIVSFLGSSWPSCIHFLAAQCHIKARLFGKERIPLPPIQHFKHPYRKEETCENTVEKRENAKNEDIFLSPTCCFVLFHIF